MVREVSPILWAKPLLRERALLLARASSYPFHELFPGNNDPVAQFQRREPIGGRQLVEYSLMRAGEVAILLFNSSIDEYSDGNR